MLKHISLLLIFLLSAFALSSMAQSEKDPHRPVCVSARCRKIKAFLKTHYCGESPAGNGPDDGCELRRPKKLSASINVSADFDCKWVEGRSHCQQHGQPSSEVRSILVRQMRRLGLPAKNARKLHYKVWRSKASSWSLAEADYHHITGTDLTLCEVIVVIDHESQVRVLRKVRFQKTDADVSQVTTWTPIDLADVDADGHIEVVLEGDAYEDHWLEVDSVSDGDFRTIFSGLGYYL